MSALLFWKPHQLIVSWGMELLPLSLPLEASQLASPSLSIATRCGDCSHLRGEHQQQQAASRACEHLRGPKGCLSAPRAAEVEDHS